MKADYDPSMVRHRFLCGVLAQPIPTRSTVPHPRRRLRRVSSVVDRPAEGDDPAGTSGTISTEIWAEQRAQRACGLARRSPTHDDTAALRTHR